MGHCLARPKSDLDILRSCDGRIEVCANKPYPSVAFTISLGGQPHLDYRPMKMGWENNNALNYYGYWDHVRRFRLTIRSMKVENDENEFRVFRTIKSPKYQVELSFATKTPKTLAELDYSDTSTYYIYEI